MTDVLRARDLNLHSALKTATAPSHARLESALALMEQPVAQARMIEILQGFWGFHAVWEVLPALIATARGRGRLALLENDLAALGISGGQIAALPRCTPALALCGTPARALGSLYVLEGSTLGGQIINRALGDAAWAPAGGLRYFSPYGSATGMMWRGTLALLQEASNDDADPEIIAGAIDTFDVLYNWFTRLRQ